MKKDWADWSALIFVGSFLSLCVFLRGCYPGIPKDDPALPWLLDVFVLVPLLSFPGQLVVWWRKLRRA